MSFNEEAVTAGRYKGLPKEEDVRGDTMNTAQRRTAQHYREMFEDHDGTVGRSIVAKAIYAKRHGDPDDPDRDTLADITRSLPDKPIPAGDALEYLEDTEGTAYPVVIVEAGADYLNEVDRLGDAESLTEAKRKTKAEGYSVIDTGDGGQCETTTEWTNENTVHVVTVEAVAVDPNE